MSLIVRIRNTNPRKNNKAVLNKKDCDVINSLLEANASRLGIDKNESNNTIRLSIPPTATSKLPSLGEVSKVETWNTDIIGKNINKKSKSPVKIYFHTNICPLQVISIHQTKFSPLKSHYRRQNNSQHPF